MLFGANFVSIFSNRRPMRCIEIHVRQGLLTSEIRKSSLNQTQNDGKNHCCRHPEHQ